MPDNLTLDEILTLNPHVNSKTLQQSRDLLARVRKGGTRTSKYRLVSPHTRRRSDGEFGGDSRAVRLRRTSR
jgi:hypothetical protein